MDASQVSLDLTALNIYFTSPPITINSIIKTNTLAFLSNVIPPDSPPFIFFIFKTVTWNVINRDVRPISRKAIGCDRLSIFFWMTLHR